MDGTFGGGDLISASLAIMLGGGDDSVLHDKSVSLSTSDVTGSQTAIFEYDPQDEPVSGDPPGPWDGYSLFTIDLSSVKDDIEDLQQQLSDLEDCRDAVIAKIQEYDPQFNPQDCQDIVDKIEADEDDLVEKEELCEEVQQAIEEETGEPVVDPTDIPDIIHDLPGYEFPVGTPYDPDIKSIVGADEVTDEDLGITLAYITDRDSSGYARLRVGYKSGGTFTEIWSIINYGGVSEPDFVVWSYGMADSTTGKAAVVYSFDAQGTHITQNITSSALITFGDNSHTYKVKNKN